MLEDQFADDFLPLGLFFNTVYGVLRPGRTSTCHYHSSTLNETYRLM